MNHPRTRGPGRRRRSLALLTPVVFLAAAASCAVQGPTFCESDRDCVGGRCDILSNTCVFVADARIDTGSCDQTACDGSCRGSGYAAGSCASGSCTCSGSPDAGAEDAEPGDAGPDETPTCDPATCTSICAGLGSATGRCEADSCVCSGGGDADADTPVDDGAADESPRDDGTVVDDAGAPDEARDDGAVDEATPAEDVAIDDAATPDEAVADEAVADETSTPEDAGAPEDAAPPTGPCGGPFSGSGSEGYSGTYCLGDYSFRAIAGNTYTISTCASCSGDTYLVVSGACSCEDDDGCSGLCSECTCTATSDGDANICASTYSMNDGSWSYTVSGVCRL
ncbi:MAG: hypothetical protein HY905_05570 [Deltaproteobacteria bacterium]|nr:hypothetical protein [Deltaproteobacteria bacterium]